MKKFKRKRVIIPLIVVIVVATVVGVKQFKSNSANASLVKTQNIVTDQIQSVIIGKGEVDAKLSKTMVAQVSGNIKEVLKESGQRVAKNEIILIIDDQDINKQLREAQIQLEVEKNILKKMENDTIKIEKMNYENAKLAFNTIEKNYLKKKNLYDQEAISQVEYEEANTEYLQAKNTFEIETLQFEDNASGNDILIQKGKVELAQLKYDEVYKTFENHYIKSPFDGRITYLDYKAGDIVDLGSTLVVVKDLSQMEVTLNLNEFDAQNVHIGNNVFVTSDASKGNEYSGKVSFIDHQAFAENTSRGVQVSVRIKVDMEENIKGLKPGNTAQVEIIAKINEHALVIPYEALYDNKKGEKVVFTVVDQMIKENIIETGIESDITVEIISKDIKDGAHIVLNPSDELTEGLEVEESFTEVIVGDQHDTN